MKKAEGRKREGCMPMIPGMTLSAREGEALQAALKMLGEQSERLGLLDPLEAEPATIFFAEGGKR